MKEQLTVIYVWKCPIISSSGHHFMV